MTGSLGDLLRQAGFEASEPDPEPTPPPPARADEVRFADRVQLRRERKGRKGHTVTVVRGVLAGREQVARALGKRLGTGATVEGDLVVLRGDHRQRAARWFEEQGCRVTTA